MGLLEYIGEIMNPGKTGTVDITKRKRKKYEIHLGMLIGKTILSIAIVSILYYFFCGMSFQWKESLLFVSGITIYSVIGYYILPKPDYTNLGWFGGFFDNPFKISDDVNRMLILARVVLSPGRLISTTVLYWIDVLKR